MVTNLWNEVKDSLRNTINKQSFDMWLKDTETLYQSDDNIKIRVPDDVTRRHISDQYYRQIEVIAEQLTGQKYFFEFLTDSEYNNSDKNSNLQFNDISFQNSPDSSIFQESYLNPRYTFDNFVIGPNNQLAHAAAKAVAQSPATQYNPLFIYGESGMGKTHLMQAIGHYISREKPFLKVTYLPTEQFVNEFIMSIRTNTQDSFKIKYRNVDILMIDDIQFIEKKEETQNEFFHTFNSLYENKKQIIISSDRPPKELSTLADRLRTRFEWGMITDIQPPNFETRVAILRNKAEKESINISDDALYFIATRVRSSIRALEAALTRLKMVESLLNEQIQVSHAKSHLKDLFDVDSRKKVTVRDIMMRIAEATGVSVDEMISKSRQSRIIQPRFIAMYLSRRLTGLTTVEIGKEFGDRDHSTVLNAINKIEEDMEKDPEFREMIEEYVIDFKNI